MNSGWSNPYRQVYSILIILLFVSIISGCTNNSETLGENDLPGGKFPPTRTPFQPSPQESLATSSPTPVVEEQGLPLVTSQAPLATATTPNTEPPPAPTTTAPTTEPHPVPTDAGIKNYLWIDPSLPTAFQERITLPGDLALWQNGNEKPQDGKVLRLEAGNNQVVSRWVYALVAPFPTTVQGVSMDALLGCWKGEAVGPFAGKPILLDQSTLDNFTRLWGAPDEKNIKVVPADQILEVAWKQRPAWAIIPFEDVQPRWKVLQVSGQSPLHKDFNPETYPLTLPIALVGTSDQVETLQAQLGPGGFTTLVPPTNRIPERLTVVAVTGVTALVRATAYTMEKKGVLYPGKDVREILRQADITHISNEVPFAKNCPFPNPAQQGMRFCSDPRYIELLEDVGTDVVELTGDHFQDWGEAAMLYTLQLYKQRNWGYYGGGANSMEARQPLKIEHNGNKIAFIGCNAKGGVYAQASPGHPGAVVCDLANMAKEIRNLRAEGYLPIATFQHFEYYKYRAQPNQVNDSRLLAEAGAVIVSGSQAHQPQGLEFHRGALIHYGLGNLFFDQYDVSQATRQGFIDLHVFYDGHYLGVEFVPILFIDYARPRLMTQAEATALFRAVFKASGW